MNLEGLRPWLFWVLLVDFVAFTGQTTFVLYEYGLSWIPVVFENAVSTLVMVDLTIALSMVLGWVYFDAKNRGVSPWPSLVLTLATGSVGTLLYILVRERPGAPDYSAEATARASA